MSDISIKVPDLRRQHADFNQDKHFAPCTCTQTGLFSGKKRKYALLGGMPGNLVTCLSTRFVDFCVGLHAALPQMCYCLLFRQEVSARQVHKHDRQYRQQCVCVCVFVCVCVCVCVCLLSVKACQNAHPCKQLRVGLTCKHDYQINNQQQCQKHAHLLRSSV